jgi:predicted enzyme related to lactoylglutathione lyase
MNLVILDVGDLILTLHGQFRARPFAQDERKVAFAFSVSNLDQTVADLKKVGVKLIGGIETTPVHRFQMLEDPSGNLVEVAQYDGV